MKHIPILFSTAMVQAILEGLKTQTRRTKGLEDMADSKFKYKGIPDGLPATHAFARMFNGHWVETIHKFCPYGQPGDVLWVREEHLIYWEELSHCWIVQYKDDTIKNFYYKQLSLDLNYRLKKRKTIGKWQRGRFLPKELCRIWLEVVSVRVERLQDISESDAIAEGIGCGFQLNSGYPDYQHVNNGVCEVTQDTAAMSFCSLWQTIHEGKNSDWNNNPWVWVIEFKQIEKPENFA